MNTATPTSRGMRRPQASLIGPMASWPSAMPTMIAVNVNWIRDSGAPRSAAICGNAGRYKSVANGPVAVRVPRTSTSSATERRGRGCGACGEARSVAGGDDAGDVTKAPRERDGGRMGRPAARAGTIANTSYVPGNPYWPDLVA
ncbi:hypothetical protein GCM10027294_26550 [Marinactinospora endophytica]